MYEHIKMFEDLLLQYIFLKIISVVTIYYDAEADILLFYE